MYRVVSQHEISPGNSIYRCERCGWLSPPMCSQMAADALHGTCLKSDITPPPPSPCLATKAVSYLRGYAEHLAKGSQECEFPEILSRFTVCSACPDRMYNDVKEECASCGCYVNLLLAAEGRNKIAWQETTCPLGHWPKAA